MSRSPLTADDRRFLRTAARRTWRYFDDFYRSANLLATAGQCSGNADANFQGRGRTSGVRCWRPWRQSWFLSSAPPGRKNLQVRGALVTTRWSLILSGANSKRADTDIRAALAEICRIYWRPIFAFVSQRGCSAADAEDLTQTFFVMILKSDWLQNADPCRGRFRSLLLKSLQNFLSDAADKTYARKRGGKVSFVS